MVRRAIRALVAVAIILASAGGRLQAQSAAALHALSVAEGWQGHPEATGFVQGRLDRDGRWGPWDWSVDGAAWVDLGDVDQSLLAPADVTLRREWRWGQLRAGVAEVPWGLSRIRSPAAMVSPDALLWSLVSNPPLAGPMVELTVHGDTEEVQAMLLPLRPPVHVSRFFDETWDGRRIDPPEAWEVELGYGLRLWKSFASMDAALWWMDAADRRPWLLPAREDEEVAVRHSRTRQGGYELEWVAGATVVRSEGALGRRDGSWHSRVLLGVDWFATPYLTVLLEQGLASDRDRAASPLVDDAVLGVELVAETLRFRGGLAVDPASGTRHAWSGLRWIYGERAALEAEWVDAWGDVGDESPVTIRQRRVLRLAALWYF